MTRFSLGEWSMARAVEATIDIREVGPQKFELAVTFDGQRFECGNYMNRAAAYQAGRLFVARKEGEQTGRKKSPRRERRDR
jgi:hypothetical protein